MDAIGSYIDEHPIITMFMLFILYKVWWADLIKPTVKSFRCEPPEDHYMD